jgi:hypothetical protein
MMQRDTGRHTRTPFLYFRAGAGVAQVVKHQWLRVEKEPSGIEEQKLCQWRSKHGEWTRRNIAAYSYVVRDYDFSLLLF